MVIRYVVQKHRVVAVGDSESIGQDWKPQEICLVMYNAAPTVCHFPFLGGDQFFPLHCEKLHLLIFETRAQQLKACPIPSILASPVLIPQLSKPFRERFMFPSLSNKILH